MLEFGAFSTEQKVEVLARVLERMHNADEIATRLLSELSSQPLCRQWIHEELRQVSRPLPRLALATGPIDQPIPA